MMKTATAVALALGLGSMAGCATTDSLVTNAPYAAMPDCTVIAAALELFPEPEDGSDLKVYAIAIPEDPPFMPQKPEQRSPGPLNLTTCDLIGIAWVLTNPTVTLGRPEIHDDVVVVPYSEGYQRPVHAVLEPTPEGGWRHKSAILSAP